MMWGDRKRDGLKPLALRGVEPSTGAGGSGERGGGRRWHCPGADGGANVAAAGLLWAPTPPLRGARDGVLHGTSGGRARVRLHPPPLRPLGARLRYWS